VNSCSACALAIIEHYADQGVGCLNDVVDKGIMTEEQLERVLALIHEMAERAPGGAE
jgi:hypothetical protein